MSDYNNPEPKKPIIETDVKKPRGLVLHEMALRWLKTKKKWAENPNNPKNKEAKN